MKVDINKTILDYLEQEIQKNNKRKMEYLEVGRNPLAEKYEAREWLLEEIENLVRDGLKYREEKNNER